MAGNPGRSDRKPSGEIRSRHGWSTRILSRRPEQLNLALKAAALTAPSPGACWPACSKPGSGSRSISSASAGALNAVVLATGWLRDGTLVPSRLWTSCGGRLGGSRSWARCAPAD